MLFWLIGLFKSFDNEESFLKGNNSDTKKRAAGESQHDGREIEKRDGRVLMLTI